MQTPRLNSYKVLFVTLFLFCLQSRADGKPPFTSESATSRWSLWVDLVGIGGDMGAGIMVASPQLGSSNISLALGVIDYASSLRPTDFSASNPAGYVNLVIKCMEFFQAAEDLKIY